MSAEPATSVVVVCCQRAHALAECLDSLAAQTVDDFEVVVVCNDVTPAVANLVAARLGEQVRRVELGPGITVSQARNHGVAAARAKALYFIDDDVIVPPDTLAELARAFAEHRSVDIFGGPNLTPPDDPDFAQLTGEILASLWGTGVTRLRYAKAPAQPATERHLILCNLAVRRSVFEAGIRFPVLFGGEENVLMGHADQQGFKLRYLPELWVYHRRRATLRDYVAQVYRYGCGRALALRFAPRTRHPAYLVPVGFTGYLLALPVLALAGPVAALPLAAYGAVVGVESVRIAVRRRAPRWLPVLPPLFLVTHVTYAVGLAVTLVHPPKPDVCDGPIADRGRTGSVTPDGL
jgi:GT2 family glycosyltransferase